MKTRTFTVLYHIGTLNAADKLKNVSTSNEGHGLSVSQCPDAWRQIAKLGGYPLWRLTRQGNAFLDYNALTQDERKTIETWGANEKWIYSKAIWAGEYWDDEAEAIRCLYEETHAKLLSELEGLADLEAEDTRVEKRWIPAAKPALHRYHGFEVDDMSVPHLLAVAYVDKVLRLDGVFWDNHLDPYGYSAPCAVILPHRVPDWTVEPASDAEWFFEPGDDEGEE